MPNGDPTVFGFPCRFPAAPSIRSESRVQGFDQKRLSVRARSEKKFFPEFPGAAGEGRRYPVLFRPFRAAAASGSAIAASFFLRPSCGRPPPAAAPPDGGRERLSGGPVWPLPLASARPRRPERGGPSD